MLLVVGVNLVHSQLHPRLHCRAQLRMHQIEHDRHTASLRAGAIPQYPPPARMDAPPARPQDRKIPYGVWGCILRGGQLAGGATLESGAPPATRLDRRDPARKNGCTSRKTARPQDPLGSLEMHLAGRQLAGGASLQSDAPPPQPARIRGPRSQEWMHLLHDRTTAKSPGASNLAAGPSCKLPPPARCTSRLPRGSCGLAVLREVHQTYTREGPLYKTIVYTREGPIYKIIAYTRGCAYTKGWPDTR